MNLQRSYFAIATTILLVSSLSSAYSQVGAPDPEVINTIKNQNLNVFASVGFMVNNPQGSYRRGLDTIGLTGSSYGFNVNGGYYFDPVPVALSMEAGFLFHRSQTKRDYLTHGLFQDTLDYETSFNNIPINLSVRLQPNLYTWVFPYFEVVGGAVFTTGSYSIEQKAGERTASRNESESDVAWQYGIGVGASFKFADYIDLPNTLQRFFVDVRMRYLWGSKQDLTAFELNQTNGTYQSRKTSIANPETIHFSIGVGVQF